MKIRKLLLTTLFIVFSNILIIKAYSSVLFELDCTSAKSKDREAICWLFNELNLLKSDIETLNDAADTLKPKLEALENTVNSQDTQILNLETKVNDLENNQTPETSEVSVFPFGWLNNGQESSILDLNGYKLITFKGHWANGVGGFHFYYSDNQVDWNYQDDLSGDSNNSPVQRTLLIKGKYYKVKIVNTFSGSASAILQ